jgi:putative ABC transport system substrate-binding protein
MALIAPHSAFAQQAKAKIPRIGWVVTGDPTSYRFSLAAFREGLKEHGYVEGQNIIIEYKWAEGVPSRLPQLARELVEQRVDIIVTGGPTGAQAAKSATGTIPVVVAGAGDLADSGIVASLARPGGNITGFSVQSPETAGKQIEIVKEILPNAKTVAVLWGGATTGINKRQREVVEATTAALKLVCTWYAPNTPSELEEALNSLGKAHPDFLLVLSTPFLFTHRASIAKFARKAQLPSVHQFSEFVDDGGLVSYGSHISDSYRRAAGYVDKILKGANPATLPVELPSRFELVVNMKTAKTIGITVPKSILLRADRVIE